MTWLTSRKQLFGAPALLLAGAAIFGLSACESTGDLTVDLPDTAPTSSEFLDLPVSAATVLLDPALTLKSDRVLVGRLRDQVTGLTEARGVLNLRASTALDSLPGRLENAALESVVLLAPFEQVYGTATAPLRLDVLPLTQKLDDRVVYTAASAAPTGPALAAGLSAPLNATRQVTQTATDGTGAPITTTVPDPIVRQVLQSGAVSSPALSAVFARLNKATFAQTDLDAVLPGLVLAPSAGYEGSIVAFGRGRLSTQLKFTYTYDFVTATTPVRTTERRTGSYSLFFGPGRASSGAGAAEDPRYYTQLLVSRAGSPLAALSGPAEAVPAAALDGRSYLQAGLGLGTRITFGGLTKLEELRAAGAAINRAELIVPVVPLTTGIFPNPASFYALEVDAQNQVLTRTIDGVLTERAVQREGFSQLRNDFEAAATLVNPNGPSPSYSLPITSYLQAYLTPGGLGTGSAGDPLPLPFGLLLTPTLRSITGSTSDGKIFKSSPSLTLNRAMLDANNIRLRVYYSKLR